MEITAVLTEHHAVLRQLFEQSKSQPDVFDEFIRNLTVHHTMEEKYFYDILEQLSEARHDALEAVNEHHIIELIIKDAERFPRDHERFPVKIESLGEYTSHHLDEEEEEIFPMAREIIPEQTLATLGQLFSEAKEKLLGVKLPEVPAAIAAHDAKQPPPADQSSTAQNRASSEKKKPRVQDLGIGSLKE